MKKPTLTFIPIKTNQEKIEAIADTILRLFLQGEKVLVTVPSREAALAVERLLWKNPQEAFLPHDLVESPTSTPIAITTSHANWNKATALLNLCSEPFPLFKEFEKIFELFDQTSPDKLSFSEKKQTFYNSQLTNSITS